MTKLTIPTFLMNKMIEMIKVANVAKGYKVTNRQRKQIIEELLLVFTNEKQLIGDSLSKAFIYEKALASMAI